MGLHAALGCAVLLGALGCGPSPDEPPASRGATTAIPAASGSGAETGKRSGVAPPVAPAPAPAAAPAVPAPAAAPTSSTTLAPPLATPDDARRLLERQGVDPERLSHEVAEQMRRRFEPPPAE